LSDLLFLNTTFDFYISIIPVLQLRNIGVMMLISALTYPHWCRQVCAIKYRSDIPTGQIRSGAELGSFSKLDLRKNNC
jgi:hypothetical protein